MSKEASGVVFAAQGNNIKGYHRPAVSTLQGVEMDELGQVTGHYGVRHRDKGHIELVQYAPRPITIISKNDAA